MNNELKIPNLLDKEAVGGDIAEGGFSFQGDLILARIPAWLACNGFTGMIREALGDAEARFFIPHAGIVHEFVEYKNHDLSPARFWPEIERFQTMDIGHPGSYWRFILVCTGVSDILQPMLNALRRVRTAFPFYAETPTIQDASYRAFVDTLRRLDKDENLALFLFNKVFVDTDPPKSTSQGFNMFRGELERYFPVFQDLGTSSSKAAWNALSDLVRSRKAQPISRAELETAIWSGVKREHVKVSPLRLYTANEAAIDRWTFPAEISFDWSKFSGGDNRNFPPSEEWNKTVVSQLFATKKWIIEAGQRRRITLSGQRRLSAAVAIGAVFNVGSGFAIDLHIRGEVWSTDAHASADTPNYRWNINGSTKDFAKDLAIAIGIGRDITPEVCAYLAAEQLDIPLLTLTGDHPLISAQQTNLAVHHAKIAILEAIAKIGANTIHLFLATPSQFALFLGHRLNATGYIQCYERIKPNMYHPTCRVMQL